MVTFTEHGPMTLPGIHVSAVDAVPGNIESILKAVRGLFVHGDFLEFYGLHESEISAHSRETLSVEKRLDRIFAKSNLPLNHARPLNCREVGTCRDYAVMTCGLLRQNSIPARVRCGFARYFSPGRFEEAVSHLVV